MSMPGGQEAPRLIPLSGGGYAALASLRLEGNGAAARVGEFLRPSGSLSWSRCQVGDLVFGHWGAEDGEEVVASRLTGDAVEIHCHGGLVSREQLIESLLATGCHLMNWDDWIMERAADPIEAAATNALTRAKTTKVAMVLHDQLRGALREAVVRIVDHVGKGENREAEESLDHLLAKAPFGSHLISGWRVVLIGHPNVGKSSLLNAVLGYERSIVLSGPGTTRDMVAATTALDGWPVELVDTAGVRAEAEAVEEAGMRLAINEATDADLVLLVSDASRLWTDQEKRWQQQFPRTLIVHNKWDLSDAVPTERPEGVKTIATTSSGVDRLCRQIVSRMVDFTPQPQEAVPFTAAQAELLRQAQRQLHTGEGERAVDLLKTELLGRQDTAKNI
ncbi:MAG: GTP-binding protein [Pirellulales bacterium]|nr:GTP-binding protein [Pirellulales bacterium]